MFIFIFAVYDKIVIYHAAVFYVTERSLVLLLEDFGCRVDTEVEALEPFNTSVGSK